MVDELRSVVAVKAADGEGERVRRLRAEGWSWGPIARQLGITVAAARRACPRVETGSELCQKPPEGFWQGNVETAGT